jgi:hypothetical protein
MTFIEIGNSSYILVNNSSMSNNTYLGDVYNFSMILPAGNWYWKSYANDSSGNWNTSDSWDFTIGKAPTNVTLLIDGSGNNATVDANWTVNLTAYSNVSGLTINISSNISGWTEPTGTSSVQKIFNESQGFYNMTAYTLDNQNYSGNSKTLFLNITSITPQFSSVWSSTDNAYASGKSYTFNITWQDGSLDDVIFNIYNTTNSVNITFDNVANFSSITTVNSNTKIYSATVSNLPAGSYNYTWIANDSFGYSNSTSYTYSISKASTTLTLGSTAGWTIAPNTLTTFSCAVTPSALDVILQVSTATPVTGTSSVSTSATLVGSTTVICQTSGNANYSANSTSQIITVTTQQQQGSPTSPPQQTFIFAIQNLPSKVSVDAGESATASFNIRNTYQFNMTVSIALKDISSDWYSLSRNSFNVKINGTEPVTITFNVPSSAEVKNYTIKVNATGRSSGGITKTDEKTMTLSVNPSTAPPTLPAQNVTNQTVNQTTNQTASNATIGAEGPANETAPTGLSIRPEDFRNLVLILGVIAIAIVFMFRNNITNFLVESHKTREQTEKKSSAFSFLKTRFGRYNGYRLVIKVKDKEKEEKT